MLEAISESCETTHHVTVRRTYLQKSLVKCLTLSLCASSSDATATATCLLLCLCLLCCTLAAPVLCASPTLSFLITRPHAQLVKCMWCLMPDELVTKCLGDHRYCMLLQVRSDLGDHMPLTGQDMTNMNMCSPWVGGDEPMTDCGRELRSPKTCTASRTSGRPQCSLPAQRSSTLAFTSCTRPKRCEGRNAR